MKNIFVAALVLFPLSAFADAQFHCYSKPNFPARVFEYASSECNDTPPTGKELIKGNGEREILCQYDAYCRPMESPMEKTQDLTDSQVDDEFRQGHLRIATLVCRGNAEYDGGMKIAGGCPELNACRQQVFYNPLPLGKKDKGVEKLSAPKPSGTAQ